jgi:tRNA pseudouridine38-40 synthase
VPRAFKLTIAYDGTDFAGWQVQPGQQTIQGNLHRALQKITGNDVHVVGSGRTDAGVHAIAQVASLTLPNWRHSAGDLMRAINVHLPETIAVTDALDAPENFHAIRDAIGKRYRYQLQIGGPRDVIDFRYRWRLKGPLRLDNVRIAASAFVGRHDFASFQAAGGQRKSTIRTVAACDVIEQGCDPVGRHHVAIEIEADGFLYNMVRNIVGTLVEVGWGRRTPDSIAEILARGDRDAAGQTAPANALFLLRVDYEPFDCSRLSNISKLQHSTS